MDAFGRACIPDRYQAKFFEDFDASHNPAALATARRYHAELKMDAVLFRPP